MLRWGMWHPAVTVLNTDVSLLPEQIKGVTVLLQLSEGFPKITLPLHHHHCWPRSACTEGSSAAWAVLVEHLNQQGAGMEPCQCVWELGLSPSRASLFLLEAWWCLCRYSAAFWSHQLVGPSGEFSLGKSSLPLHLENHKNGTRRFSVVVDLEKWKMTAAVFC